MTGLLGRIMGALRAGGTDAANDRFEDLAPDLADDDARRVGAGLEACIAGRGGQRATLARCAALGRAYGALAPEGRRRFLEILAHDFAPGGAAALAAVADLDEFDDWRGKAGQRRLATEALEPPRWRLLAMFAGLTGGEALLRRMRDDLAAAPGDDSALAELAADLERVLANPR